MRQRYFITSTGTGIGKSFITAGLARQAKALGKSIAALKPVVSGFDPATIGDSDTGLLLRAAGLLTTAETIEHVSPWRFRQPLAPSTAARLEKRALDFGQLVAHGRKAMEGPEDAVFIEGVGGVMVPLTDKHTVLDWIEALEIEAILVAGSYLGTLSHTLTALAVLAQRKIPVFAIIVNESEDSTVPLQATIEELPRFTSLPLIPVARRKSPNGWQDLSELRALIA